MERIKFSLVALALASMAVAQTPQAIKYQSIVRDNAGVELTNQTVGFRISVLQGNENGPAVYVETHAVTTNPFGLANLNIGSGNVVSGVLATIDWSADAYFFQIELDATGGTNYQFMGTSQALSVPYALHARTAETVTGGSAGQWAANGDGIHNANAGNVGIGITDPQQKLDVLGNALVRGTEFDSFGDSAVLFLGDGTSSVQSTYGTGLQFYTYPGGIPGITLQTSTNNVGIGTVAPAAKLDVAGTFKLSDGTQGAGKVLTSDANGLATWMTPSNGGTGWALSGNNLSNTNNGNVGIGTSAPIGRLQVNAPTSSVSSPAIMTEMVGANLKVYKGNNSATVVENTSGTNLTFQVSGGKVGIGTTSPDGRLQVNAPGSSSSSPALKAELVGANLLVYKGANSTTVVENTSGTNLTLQASGGNVGIGTTTPQSKLAVNGKITCKEVEVTLAGFPDYVFEENYRLMPLSEVEAYIAAKGHLPNVPSACEVEENGLGLGEMNKILLEKVEELTLHAIAKEKELEELKRGTAERIARLEALIGGGK